MLQLSRLYLSKIMNIFKINITNHSLLFIPIITFLLSLLAFETLFCEKNFVELVHCKKKIIFLKKKLRKRFFLSLLFIWTSYLVWRYYVTIFSFILYLVINYKEFAFHHFYSSRPPSARFIIIFAFSKYFTIIARF